VVQRHEDRDQRADEPEEHRDEQRDDPDVERPAQDPVQRAHPREDAVHVEAPSRNCCSNAAVKLSSSSLGRWLIPAAVFRPPPVGNLRQNASAETENSFGTRTETRNPPSVFGETIATALPPCA